MEKEQNSHLYTLTIQAHPHLDICSIPAHPHMYTHESTLVHILMHTCEPTYLSLDTVTLTRPYFHWTRELLQPSHQKNNNDDKIATVLYRLFWG